MDPLLVTSVEKEVGVGPVLIIDRKGIIGAAIYEKIKKELASVLVSSVKPETTQNLIFIHYKNHIPEIPDGKYSIIIFVSDNEKYLWDLVKECVEKAQHDAIKFVFITDYDKVDEKVIAKSHELYEESYSIVLGELFGQEHSNSLLDSVIYNAATTGTIKLPHIGLRKTHPILFADAIHGILQAIFGIHKPHKLTFLYQQHTFTDLSIAHLLQKIDPLIHIDFLKEDKRKIAPEHKEPDIRGNYFFDQDYSVTEKIRKVYHDIQATRKNKADNYVYKQEIKPFIDLRGERTFISDAIKRWGGIVLYCLAIILGIPLLSLGVSVLIAGTSLTAAKNAINKGEIVQAKQKVSIAHTSFVFDRIIKEPILFEMQIIGLGGLAQQLDTKITTGEHITSALQNLFTAEESLKQILSGSTQTPDATARGIVSVARSSLVALQKVATDNPDEKELLSKIGKYQQGIDLLSGTITLLPHVLASNEKHTYLLLFQNNMELRPGGGFIGSYGLVTFDHGKMSDISIHDVYDADGQLRQHVDPPFALRRYMENVHLYLRDSNFDTDFVVDAQKAAELLQLESGQKVDGIMAVDLTFVKYLLAATGPVYVPGQNVSVTPDNFFLLTEEHAEKHSFPGSTQKKDFLSSVFTALQNTLQAQKQVSMSVLLEKSLQAIQEKHLVFALAEPSLQNVLTVNGLSSSLWDPRMEASGTINDFMGINEANIGVNKVNYFIKRSVKQAVTIDGDGTLKGEVQIAYTNTSKQNEWPGGDYKNYLRIMLPANTTLTGISFDGQKQATHSAITDPLMYEAKGFKAPQELEVEQTQESGKMLYAFLVTVSAASAKTVHITYEHNQKINLANPVLHYNLRLYKQPGTNNDPFSFAFNYPLEYSLLSASPKNADGSSSYTVDTQLSADKTISVDLTKK